jgi:hypothetical protein
MALEPISSPEATPEIYDVIKLGGVTSPGIVTLSGHDRVINWDIKVGKGQSGARMSLKDVPPCEFQASFYLATAEDYADWAAFKAAIDSTVAATPKALDIYHPDLAEQDIKSVVKGTIMGTVHDGKGGRTIAVKFVEYRPPKKKTGGPSGSSSKSKKKASGPDPDAAALAELERLKKQYEATPWG